MTERDVLGDIAKSFGLSQAGERWIASDPSTRMAGEEDIVEHLAWPRNWGGPPDINRARAVEGLERLVRMGLPYRMEADGRRFDPYEVFFFMRWAHHRLGDPLWAEGVDIARSMASEYLPANREKRRFRLLFEREIPLEPQKADSSFRTQFPLPAADDGQDGIEIRPMESAELRFERDDQVLDVRATVSAGSLRSARFAVEISFSAAWRGETIDPARVEPFRAPESGHQAFLAALEGPIRVSERIRRLSAALAADARTPWDAVRRFWRFLIGRIVFGRIHPQTLSSDDPLWSTLESGFSDCYLGSALFASLCRARGIPSRLVFGYPLLRHVQANHYWTEVWVAPYGWVPCDLSSSVLADGDIDNEWSEFFLGRVDPRIVIERYPRRRLILDVPIRKPSYTLQLPCDRGMSPGNEIIIRDLSRNALICRDRVRAHDRLGAGTARQLPS